MTDQTQAKATRSNQIQLKTIFKGFYHIPLSRWRPTLFNKVLRLFFSHLGYSAQELYLLDPQSVTLIRNLFQFRFPLNLSQNAESSPFKIRLNDVIKTSVFTVFFVATLPLNIVLHLVIFVVIQLKYLLKSLVLPIKYIARKTLINQCQIETLKQNFKHILKASYGQEASKSLLAWIYVLIFWFLSNPLISLYQDGQVSSKAQLTELLTGLTLILASIFIQKYIYEEKIKGLEDQQSTFQEVLRHFARIRNHLKLEPDVKIQPNHVKAYQDNLIREKEYILNEPDKVSLSNLVSVLNEMPIQSRINTLIDCTEATIVQQAKLKKQLNLDYLEATQNPWVERLKNQLVVHLYRKKCTQLDNQVQFIETWSNPEAIKSLIAHSIQLRIINGETDIPFITADYQKLVSSPDHSEYVAFISKRLGITKEQLDENSSYLVAKLTK